MEKILIISPVHKADDIRVYKKQALSLVNAGYNVSLIVKKDNSIDINALSIPIIQLHYKNRLARILSIPKIIFIALKEHADVYHIHNPDTLPVGLFLKLFGKKVIYDTHENFRKKILLRKWIPKSIRSVVANSVFYGEKFLSYCFDATIVTQEEQCEDYARACLIGNSPILLEKGMFTLRKKEVSESIKLVYVGGISEDRGLGNMMNLCLLMNEITPTELHLIGPVINSLTKNDLLNIVDQYDNVFYEGILNQDVAFEFIKKSNYGLILLDDVADYSDTSPNKLFEYMMLGTPFIATDFIKWKSFLVNEGAGFFISPESIDSNFAKSLISFKDDISSYASMVNAGIEFVNNKYNWGIIDEPVLLELYRKVLSAK